jgi:ABC-type branched-subunit amino acid transport system permease subunit
VIWTINNFVTSTMGKALNAVRDDESAAEAMTVDTRKTKMTAFLFGAFWAGVAGGLLAHVLRYVNPAMFSVQKLAEVLAMVYFGGLNSVYGSIVGAVSISSAGRGLRPSGNSQVDRYSIIAHSGDDLSAHRAYRLQGIRCPAGVRTQGGGLICRFFTSPT